MAVVVAGSSPRILRPCLGNWPFHCRCQLLTNACASRRRLSVCRSCKRRRKRPLKRPLPEAHHVLSFSSIDLNWNERPLANADKIALIASWSLVGAADTRLNRRPLRACSWALALATIVGLFARPGVPQAAVDKITAEAIAAAKFTGGGEATPRGRHRACRRQRRGAREGTKARNRQGQ